MQEVPNRVIGIPAYRMDTHMGAGANHLEFIRQFGRPRILMPDDGIEELDMLYLPGGLDLAPQSYGRAPSFHTTNTDVFKQWFFDERLQGYIDNGTPIFGVCLGFQQLVAKFGCELEQNFLYHAQSDGRWKTAHRVNIVGNTHKGVDFISPKLKAFSVNSHHHQGLTTEGIDRSQIRPLAITKNDDMEGSDIIEAFVHKSLPIAGVQWHPEELYDGFSYGIITKLLLNEA